MNPLDVGTSRPVIAVGSVFQESNGFAGIRCQLADFEALTLVERAEVHSLAGSSSEVGGALHTLATAGARVVPTVVARAAPGGILSQDCWRELRDRIVRHLRLAGPVDGVILAMHGSMVAEGSDDPEGELLSCVRGLLGSAVPVVATLDMHANITATMVRHASALIPYHTYPHNDCFDIGAQAARLVLRLAHGEPAPGMTFVRLPMLSPGANAQTIGDGPMARLSQLAQQVRDESGLEDLAIVHAHPHNDLPELGNGVLATGGTVANRRYAAVRVAEAFWALRFALEAEIRTVADAVSAAPPDGAPVVIADWSDCVGGGAAGDSVWPLRGLLEQKLTGEAHVAVVDPDAAAACVAAGVSQTVDLTLGHALDPAWGDPLAVRARVVSVHPNATFVYTGGLYGGALGHMGDAAVVSLDHGRIKVLITSQRTYEWRVEQYAAVGLDPEQASYIVVKNPMNFRPTYEGLTNAFVPVSLPGATTPVLRDLPYRRLPRPYFPLDYRDSAISAPLALIDSTNVDEQPWPVLIHNRLEHS